MDQLLSRIKQAMREHGISAQDIADRTGMEACNHQQAAQRPLQVKRIGLADFGAFMLGVRRLVIIGCR